MILSNFRNLSPMGAIYLFRTSFCPHWIVTSLRALANLLMSPFFSEGQHWRKKYIKIVTRILCKVCNVMFWLLSFFSHVLVRTIVINVDSCSVFVINVMYYLVHVLFVLLTKIKIIITSSMKISSKKYKQLFKSFNIWPGFYTG